MYAREEGERATRGDRFELVGEEFERQIAEHGMHCEFCVRPGEGIGDGAWVCAEHYDILIAKGWTE